MLVTELLESKTFEVAIQSGRHRRTSQQTLHQIMSSSLFTVGEKKRISQLQISDKIETQRHTNNGTSVVLVIRKS